jgi:hypothetical protein
MACWPIGWDTDDLAMEPGVRRQATQNMAAFSLAFVVLAGPSFPLQAAQGPARLQAEPTAAPSAESTSDRAEYRPPPWNSRQPLGCRWRNFQVSSPWMARPMTLRVKSPTAAA